VRPPSPLPLRLVPSPPTSDWGDFYQLETFLLYILAYILECFPQLCSPALDPDWEPSRPSSSWWHVLAYLRDLMSIYSSSGLFFLIRAPSLSSRTHSSLLVLSFSFTPSSYIDLLRGLRAVSVQRFFLAPLQMLYHLRFFSCRYFFLLPCGEVPSRIVFFLSSLFYGVDFEVRKRTSFFFKLSPDRLAF